MMRGLFSPSPVNPNDWRMEIEVSIAEEKHMMLDCDPFLLLIKRLMNRAPSGGEPRMEVAGGEDRFRMRL